MRKRAVGPVLPVANEWTAANNALPGRQPNYGMAYDNGRVVPPAQVCAVILPGSVSEDGYYIASDQAMDAGLALPGIIVVVLISRRRPYPRGCCIRRGYDLTGNESGRCPECGRAANK